MVTPRRTGWIATALAATPACCLLAFAALAGRDWFEVHTTRLYCAQDAHAIHEFGVERLWLAALGVVLLVLARPIGNRVARAGVRRTAARAVTLLVAVALALVTADLFLRAKHRRLASPPQTCQLPPTHPDPDLGWAYDPSIHAVLVDGDRPITYDFDAHGDRVAAPGATPVPDAPTILFVGESVTMGLGLPWDETYPALAGKQLGLPVVNIGVHGYGDDQTLLRTWQRLPELHRPVAVVMIAMAELLSRDVADWRPRLALGGDGRFRTVKPQPEWARTSPVRQLFETLVPYHSEEAIHIARATYAAVAAAARERGAYPLFLLTNYYWQCEPDETGAPSIERRLFGGLDVDHVRVDLDRSWIIPSNGHPDARANRLLADAVAGALERREIGTRR
ncbi:MAG TPA: hypothetical protein VGG39_09255 [Polyangiaceae bacterium]|jgi:hypothetical protein